MTTLAEIKKDYDLSAWAESNLGLVADSARSNKRRSFYYSPFRNERTASFVIRHDSQTWCDYGGDERGDIIDLIQKIHHCSVIEAKAILTGTPPPPPLTPKPAMKIEKPKTEPPTLTEVVQYANNIEQARSYFSDVRGLSHLNISAHRLGAKVSTRYYTFKSEKLQRRPKLVVERRDYTIPYMAGNQVRCMNRRRDDEFAREQLESFSKSLVDDLKVDIAATKTNAKRVFTPDDITVADILDAVWFSKYLKLGEYWGYNVNTLLQLDWQGDIEFDAYTRNPKLRPLGVLVITEGEIDALTLIQHGLSAIAMKPIHYTVIGGQAFDHEAFKRYLKRITSKAVCKVVIADNDAPGLIKAQKTSEMIDARVLIPPAPYKDVNEMHVAGELTNWLKKNNLI